MSNMKILYCKVMPLKEGLEEDLRLLGHSVDILPHEFDDIEDYTKYDLIIGFQLFKFHEVEAFTNLKYVVLYSSGMDHLPLEQLKERNVQIFNAEDVYSSSISEFVVMRVLSVLKENRYFEEHQRNQVWKQKLDLDSLAHKKILIIGNGNITNQLVQKFIAFDAKITIVSRTPQEGIHGLEALEEELNKADIVIVSIALSPLTYHILNERTLGCMREHTMLVNIARGPIIDEESLLKVMDVKNLKVILDVFEHEPLAQGHPLWSHPNAYVSSHNSFASMDAFERLYKHILKTVKKQGV